MSLFLLLLVGCVELERQIPLVENVEISGWSSAAVLRMDNQDTLSRRDLSIFLRFVPNYLSANRVTLNVVTTAPDHTMIAERVTFVLEGEEGSRGGEQRLSLYPYRQNVMFGQVGEYRISIYPVESIEGVTAVGVELE